MVAISCPSQSPHPATCLVAQNPPLSSVMCHREKAPRRQPACLHLQLPLPPLSHLRRLPDGLAAARHAVRSCLAGAPALPPRVQQLRRPRAPRLLPVPGQGLLPAPPPRRGLAALLLLLPATLPGAQRDGGEPDVAAEPAWG